MFNKELCERVGTLEYKQDNHRWRIDLLERKLYLLEKLLKVQYITEPEKTFYKEIK